MPKFLIVFLICLVSVLAVAAPAMAMDWRQSDRVVVGRDEVIDDDLWCTGTNVTVDGTINGDLFAFGGSIAINGTVNGNLITAGDRVEVKGTVTGSVYGAASHINISGRIERALVAGGSDVTLEPGAYVGHSGLLCGDRVNVDGQIGRGIKAFVNDLHIGSGAAIEGPVDYYSSGSTAIVEQGARTGPVAFHQMAPRVNATWMIVWKVARPLGFLLVGLSLLALFPGLRSRYPEIVMKRPWRAPVAGLAALIVVPIGTVLLLFTLIGIPFSLVTMALFPVLIYLSQVLVSWTVGKLLADKVEWFRNLSWPVIFLMGTILTSVVVAAPGVGCLLGFIALLYGLGGLYYLMIGRAA